MKPFLKHIFGSVLERRRIDSVMISFVKGRDAWKKNILDFVAVEKSEIKRFKNVADGEIESDAHPTEAGT